MDAARTRRRYRTGVPMRNRFSTPSTPAPRTPGTTQDSWYERRKRALTLAALPQERYRSALEVGCSIGTLTADLAPRCDNLLAVDASGTGWPGLRTAGGFSPGQRPAAGVCRSLAGGQLRPGGGVRGWLLPGAGRAGCPAGPHRGSPSARAATLVLCHWRHPIDGLGARRRDRPHPCEGTAWLAAGRALPRAGFCP